MTTVQTTRYFEITCRAKAGHIHTPQHRLLCRAWHEAQALQSDSSITSSPVRAAAQRTHLLPHAGWPRQSAARCVAPTVPRPARALSKRQLAIVPGNLTKLGACPELAIKAILGAHLGMQQRRLCICRLCPVSCLDQQPVVLSHKRVWMSCCNVATAGNR